MYNCIEENVQFDDLQSVHVTLFKPCSKKPKCYDKYSSEEANDYWRKHPTRLECFPIQEIVACRLEKGMPEFLKHVIGETRAPG